MMRKIGLLIFLLSPVAAGACELAGLSGGDLRLIDRWVSPEGYELCLYRHENYSVAVKIQKMTSQSSEEWGVDEFLRYYLDERFAEIETEQDRERWERLRALVVGSILDLKHDRLELFAFKKSGRSWKKLPVLLSGEVYFQEATLELYFRRLESNRWLLSDHSSL